MLDEITAVDHRIPSEPPRGVVRVRRRVLPIEAFQMTEEEAQGQCSRFPEWAMGVTLLQRGNVKTDPRASAIVASCFLVWSVGDWLVRIETGRVLCVSDEEFHRQYEEIDHE